MEVHEYMDSHYNTYPIMNIDAEIEGRKAKLYIGPSIYITDGNVSAAYYGENYHYVYGEIIEKELEEEIISSVMEQYNLENPEEVFEMINELLKA